MAFNLSNLQMNVVLYLSILQRHGRIFQPVRSERNAHRSYYIPFEFR